MCIVTALCKLKPQIKIRDNLLELELIWSHHYLQQKHLAVLLSIFRNTTAPTHALGISLFPDFTQVSLPTLSAFVVAVLEEKPVSSFFILVFGQMLEQIFFFPLKPI